MEINPEVSEILKKFNIAKDEGLLCLLGIYFKLDIESIAPERVIKAINVTKIVEKDYSNKSSTIIWNVPLFLGQQTNWDWIKDWNNQWNANMSRKASNPDVLKRMQEFFKKYPLYRVEDVMKATQLYMSTTTPGYFKNSAAFIFDGAGAMKKSILLGWCEKLKQSGGNTTQQKGKIVS